MMALLGAALLLGVMFTTLFFEKSLGGNVPLFFFLVVVVGLFLTRLFSKKIEKSHVLLLVLALFFSFMVFVRSSMLLTFFNGVGTVLLLFIVVSSFSGQTIKKYVLGDFIRVVLLPVRFIKPFFDTLAEIFVFRKNADDKNRYKEIVRGSFLALVVLFIFGLLFASADLVFQQILTNVFFFEVDPEVIARIVMSVIVGAFFIGAFGFMFRTEHKEIAPQSEWSRKFGDLEMKIVLGSMGGLFLLFIGLQLTYLFGGEAHLLSQGLTYAEYARRGFFELVLVALFSFAIILITERLVVQKESAHLTSFKVLSTILVSEVVLILVSAFVRLSLYEQAYGFSTIRLYSYAFMIWIGVVLVLLSHHILSGGTIHKLSIKIFYCVVLLLFTMNVINPDAFIAKKNIARYEKTTELDTRYLAQLSDDAIPVTVNLLDSADIEIKDSFLKELLLVRFSRNSKKKAWFEYTLPGLQATKILESRKIY